MRYYYAEILYALEEYQNAYEQYVKVAADTAHDDYKKVCATNLLLSAEKLVDIEAGRYKVQVEEGAKIDENKSKGDVAKAQIKLKVDKDSKEEELTASEKQLVAACDRYNELVPDAEDESKVRLRAAVLFFDRIQYVEAAKRFEYIIQKWPGEKTSATAAGLILESLEVKEQWAELNRISRNFQQNKKLLEGKDKEEFRKKLPVYVEGSQFKLASEANDKEHDQARSSGLFLGFVAEFPKSHLSPIALANAFYFTRDAKQLDAAMQLGERMLAEYKDCDSGDWLQLPSGDKRDKKLLPDLLFSLAKLYEQTADFEKAAGHYEKFLADHKDDDRAPDAQFNAALWYKGLGETDKAIKAFDRYVAAFKDRRKAKPEDIKRLSLPAASAVAFEQAKIADEAARTSDAYGRYKAYQADYKSEVEAWQLLDARYRQFVLASKMSKAELAKAGGVDPKAICDDIVKGYPSLSDADKKRETARKAVAQCRFLQLESTFKEFEGTKLRSPKTFKEDFDKKTRLSKELTEAYRKVVEFQNGDYAIAALVRMAMLPKLFARSLLDAPIPANLDIDQEELYRATLEQKALEFEEPAIEALELALNKAFELQIYNEWTLEAEERMKEFKPDAYGAVKEFPLRGSEFFFTAAAE
jgi:TolA-binding protein